MTDMIRFSIDELMTLIERETGCDASFHDLSGVTLEIPALKLPPRRLVHHGPYCEAVKRGGGQPKCRAEKEKANERAQKTGEPFFRVCSRGMIDFIVPASFDGAVIGAFYFGGFRARQLESINGADYRGLPVPLLTDTIRKKLAASGAMLENLTRLVVSAWVSDGHRLKRGKPEDFYRRAVQTYLETHYLRNASLSDLADKLRVHPNYLGSLIQRVWGEPFRSLLTRRRIQAAQALLAVGDLNVTQTAYAVGFNDGNYFSSVFKKDTGMTPRQYAESARSDD